MYTLENVIDCEWPLSTQDDCLSVGMFATKAAEVGETQFTPG